GTGHDHRDHDIAGCRARRRSAGRLATRRDKAGAFEWACHLRILLNGEGSYLLTRLVLDGIRRNARKHGGRRRRKAWQLDELRRTALQFGWRERSECRVRANEAGGGGKTVRACGLGSGSRRAIECAELRRTILDVLERCLF